MSLGKGGYYKLDIKKMWICNINLSQDEAQSLMHICWFALDYEKEHPEKLKPEEVELATKIRNALYKDMEN